jgi:cytochrome c biogenesis protein CcmG, thiol:disulfide interchange protein DsbE
LAIDTETQREAAEPATPRRIRILRLLAFALVPLVFVAFVGYTLLKTEPPDELVGSPMPEFSLPLLGTGGRLGSDDLEGRPVVINFWASWCIPCREEARVLEAAWKKYGPQGVHVLGVNVQDSEEDARAFAKEFGVTYPIIRDKDLTLWTKLGVSGLPETFFVDADGVFFGVGSGDQVDQSGATKILGAIDAALLDSQIRLMLARRDG